MTSAGVPSRIASIDILRALTMVLMIFVNDLWSLEGIPEWLEHTAAEEDGMGMADVVFPAFLFIVGLSIPFAVNNRRKKGDTDFQIISHIVVRAIALLVMGLFLVNGENINEQATGMHRLLWNSLCCLAFILIWNAYPSTANRWLVRSAKTAGIVILLTLAFMYRGGEGDSIHRFSTYWWGILGLIGWAYLITGILYTYLGKTIYGLSAMWLYFIITSASAHAGLITSDFLKTILSPIGEGALPALTTGGVIIAMVYLHYKNAGSQSKMLLVMTLMAIVLLILGFYTRTFWGISKIRATPAWVLICSAITIFSFVLIYWIADAKGKANWFAFLKPAGTNTLLCYLIPYFAYAFVALVGFNFPEEMLTGMTGLIKSFTFALLVVFIAGLLGRIGIQLKL
ncbi:MAG: DUF5009 domain-containing protein [Bacteroidota bacterium]